MSTPVNTQTTAKRGGMRPRLMFQFIVILLAIWLIAGFEIFRIQEDRLEQEQISTENLIRALAAHTEGAFSHVYKLLSSVEALLSKRQIEGFSLANEAVELRTIANTSGGCPR